MMESWTFGRKMAIGFAALVALLLFVSAIAIHSLETTISKKDRVIEVAMENLVTAERLSGMMDQKAALSRGYLLTQNNDFLKQLEEARAVAAALLTRLRSVVLEAEGRALIDRIESADSLHRAANDKSIHDRQNGVPLAEVVADLERDTVPRRVALRRAIDDFVQHQRSLLDEAQADAAQQADLASQAVIGGAASGVLLALVVAWTLTRHLTAQIGTAISHVQSSASELETAANQQVSGAREQASAMSEITTTISELLATSRQIAESAQRVARIAGDTASSARSGGEKLNTTERAMGEIQKQVESVVLHMLDLGKRSQEVGVILDIINELSEQTNILSINATIEAVGAGESGRRFVAVADEIRKLADRVGSSTREIRALVEKMRSAVNSTVMAIEGGTKAVESGAKQVSEVTSAFGEIVGQVGLTTEAAREIELSTKQQATAVEQVNVAIASVAQASKETETSSSQTLQTASELSSLSVELLRLIRSSVSR